MDVPDEPDRVVVEVRQLQPVLSIRATIPVVHLGDAIGERLVALSTFMRSRGIRPAGPPFVRYHTFGETTTDMETGVPIGDNCVPEGRIVSGELPSGPAITTWHTGPHYRLGEAYGRLHAWLEESGRKALGAAWEVYPWIDLAAEPDASSWSSPSDPAVQLIQPIW